MIAFAAGNGEAIQMAVSPVGAESLFTPALGKRLHRQEAILGWRSQPSVRTPADTWRA